MKVALSMSRSDGLSVRLLSTWMTFFLLGEEMLAGLFPKSPHDFVGTNE